MSRCPASSAIEYVTAGAVPLKPATGVKVTTPVVVFTTYVLAELVSVVTSVPAELTSRTEPGTSGSFAALGVSLVARFVLTAVLNGVVAVSGLAFGGPGGVTVIVIVAVAVRFSESVTR